MFCDELFEDDSNDNGCAHDTMALHPDNRSYLLYKLVELMKIHRQESR